MPGILMRAHPISLLYALVSSIPTSHYARFLRRLTHIFDVPSPCSVCVRLPVMYSQHYTQNTVWAFKIFPPRCCMHYWSEGFLILLSRSRRGGGLGGERNPGQTQHKNMKFMRTERWLILDGRGSIQYFMWVSRLLGMLFSRINFSRKKVNKSKINIWWCILLLCIV